MPTQQQQINYGNSANDGQGDPLRSAFIKTDDNFDAIWAAGPVGSNVTILNTTIATVSTNGNLILKPNGIGIVQANSHILPNTANIRDLGSSTQRWRTVYSQSVNSVNFTASGEVILPPVSDITIPGGTNGYVLQTDGAGNLSWTAQGGAGNGNPGGANTEIQFNDAGIFGGDADLTYNKNTNVLNLNGTLTALDATVYGVMAAVTMSASGNITGNYFIGDGSLLTGLSNYANANAVAFGEAGWTGNIIPASSNTYSLGNSTNYWANLWVANNTIYIGGVALGMTAGNVLTVNGNAVLSNNSNTAVTTTGNITANFFIGNGSQLTGIAATYGNANVVANLAAFGSNPISTTGNITTTANISGAYVKGNGSELTNLPAPVVSQDISSNGAVSIMLYDGNIKYNNYATVEPASGNITAGNVLTGGLISATGNITANFFIGNIQGAVGNITNLDSLNFAVENISALVGNNGVNIGAGGFNNLVVLPTEVLIQNVPLNTTGNISANFFIGNIGQPTEISSPGTDLYITAGNTNGCSVPGGDTIISGGLGYGGISHSGGNVTLRTGDNYANQWNFAYDGNLTLPSNTFAVLYANGTQVSLGGGNTGNVTFSDQVVIGTGTNDGGGGLYLAPGPDSVANSAVQYLRVRGGDYVTHIHLDTGNNAYYDQYFGADSKYVKLEAGGNIVINADDGASSATWTFDADGELNFPRDAAGNSDPYLNIFGGPTPTIQSTDVSLAGPANLAISADHLNLSGYNGMKIVLHADAGEIATDIDMLLTTGLATGPTYGWTFGADGTLTLPYGATIRDTADNAVAIGYDAGDNTQGNAAVAIGNGAGANTQGEFAVAIGAGAGSNNQGNNSIILNATGSALDQSTANTFTVAPIRNDVANVAEILFYNTTSKEITYGNTINVAGNITGGNILTGGLISATGNITGSYFLGNGSALTGIDATSIQNGISNVRVLSSGGSVSINVGGASNIALFTTTGASIGGTLSTSGFTATGAVTLATASGNINLGVSQTTGNVNVGGPTQTGTILIGQSTSSQTINIGHGITGSGNTKTIQIGENGAAGSTTNIDIGPATATTAAGTVTFNTATVVAIANTSGTALSVAGDITGGNISATGNITGNTAGFAIGYRDIPQISFTGNATLAATDAGKHYYSTLATANTLTIANNTSVSWAVGTAITVVNRGSGNITVAQGTGVSLYLAGNSSAANRTVTTYGMATLLNVAANVWMINGTGVS